jgi:uncharacterized protein with von Willebrand factor type A (vWA) domain
MDKQTKLRELLNQASNLIKTASTEKETQSLIENLGKKENNAETLEAMKKEIPLLAQKGQTKEIGTHLRILEHFNASPDVRKFLHFFAQSEAERGKQMVNSASKEELSSILTNIAQAFALANSIDQAI